MDALLTLIEQDGPRGDIADLDVDKYVDDRRRRDYFIKRYGFAVPSREAIAAIAQFVGIDRLLEVGAGSGAWANVTAATGVFITATDNHSWGQGVVSSVSLQYGLWYPVHKLGAVAAIRKYRDHNALMLCWPPYDKPMAANALRSFLGSKVIYIGEGEYGCTGDERFHILLSSEWDEQSYVGIPTWQDIHDGLYLYTRRRA